MRTIFLILCCSLLVACGPGTEVAGRASPQSTVRDAEGWRLVVKLPQAELPVQLKVARDCSQAWLENGAERVRIGEVSCDGNALRLYFPAFNNTLDLHEEGETLTGTLTLVKLGREEIMPVTGQRDVAFRHSSAPTAQVDVTGRWEVDFTADDGTATDAVAELDQKGSHLTGTFLTPSGDYRYLEGDVDGRRLNLSTFDGAHAYVFTAVVDPDGNMTGDFWSGTQSHERWVAIRNFDASLPDPYALTFLKGGYDSLEFTFPDLAGTPVSLADEKYRDKVVLVNLSGTWCPNCADETTFLSNYFRANRSRGLEIITLLYEHFEDFERAAERGKALKAQYEVDYDVLIAGVSDKTRAAETLPMLNRVLAFPTLIFIDRSGKVRRIHTGFTGPGTGAHYGEFVTNFEQTMDELLNEIP